MWGFLHLEAPVVAANNVILNIRVYTKGELLAAISTGGPCTDGPSLQRAPARGGVTVDEPHTRPVPTPTPTLAGPQGGVDFNEEVLQKDSEKIQNVLQHILQINITKLSRRAMDWLMNQ